MKIRTLVLAAVFNLQLVSIADAISLNIIYKIFNMRLEDRGPKRIGTGKRRVDDSRHLEKGRAFAAKQDITAHSGEKKQVAEAGQKETSEVEGDIPEEGLLEDRAMFKAVPLGTADSRTPRRVNENAPFDSINKSLKQEEVQIKVRITEDGGVVYRVSIPSKKVVGSSKFLPEVIRIRAGEFIEWTNMDERPHFVNKRPSTYKAFSSYEEEEEDEEDASPKQGFNSSVIKPGSNWKKQFTAKGTIQYYCFTHPQEMYGTIVVE